MFIDKIIVEGFKTFGLETTLGPFSPGINVLVGYNGSGKSSTLNAIEFVLGKDIGHLNEKRFNELFSHDNKGKNAESIKIQIIINNSDQQYPRFPSKFSLIRKITPTTNNYFLNQKKMSRKVFLKMIEQLKLQVSTIKQGQVTQFAQSSDSQRLKLLFNMINYQKLENPESNKLNDSIEKRNELMVEVRKCYSKSEKEHELSKESKILLKKKKLISYEAKKKQLAKTTNKVQQFERKLITWLETQRRKTSKYMELKSELDIMESQLTKMNNHLEVLKHTEKRFISLINELESHESKLKASIADRQKNNEDREYTLDKAKKELQVVKEHIVSDEKPIKLLKLELAGVEANVEQLKDKYEKELWKLESLKSKLSPDSMPISKEARDELIRSNIKALEDSIAEKQEYLKNYQLQRQKKIKKMMELKNNITLKKGKLEKLTILGKNCSKQLETAQKEIETAANMSRALSIEKEQVDEQLVLLKNNYNQSLKKLTSAKHYDVMYNKNAVEKTLESLTTSTSEKQIDPSKYHGFVISCFQYTKESESAVLAIAGRHLFKFVFEHGKDASTVFEKIEGHNIAAMSLDLLTYPIKTLPDSPDAIPLLTLITYKPVYKKLMEFIFANVLVCKDGKIALKFTKQYNITCVTTNGNVFFSSGLSESGNWKENERNQISIYKSMIKQLDDIKNMEKKMKELNDQQLAIDNNISKNLEQRNLLQLQIKSNEHQKMLFENELTMLESMLNDFKVDDDKHKQMINDEKKLIQRVQELEVKLNSQDEEETTSQDYQKYIELKASVESLLKSLTKEQDKVVELNKTIANKVNTLDIYLKEKNDLEKQIEELIVAKELEINDIEKENADLESKVIMLNEEKLKLTELQAEIAPLRTELMKMTSAQKEKNQKAKELKFAIDANNTDMKNLKTQCNEMTKIIQKLEQELKNTPRILFKIVDSEWENIDTMTMKQLVALQKFVDDQLRRLPEDININASGMFHWIREAFERIEITIDNWDEGRTRVMVLRERYNSELQKQIYQELSTINDNLKCVLQKFMASAKVELVLMTKHENYTVDEAKDEDVDLNNFIGVNVKFREVENGPVVKLNQLSGGQKSVISLALVLAVQKFYAISTILFDEVDHVLDFEHREILRDVLKKMIGKGQTFLVTFRPELVEAGDSFYFVQKSNAISRIIRKNKQEALKFITSNKHL